MTHTHDPLKRAFRICVLNTAEAHCDSHTPILGLQCRSHQHPHYTRERVDRLIAAGEMRWVGLHKRVATWTEPRCWRKTICRAPGMRMPTMQLVRGTDARRGIRA